MFLNKVTRLGTARFKRTRRPPRRSCKLSASKTYDQCNLYRTATRRTVAAQYSADAASLGRSVKTQRNSPTSAILLTLQPGRPVNDPEATTNVNPSTGAAPTQMHYTAGNLKTQFPGQISVQALINIINYNY